MGVRDYTRFLIILANRFSHIPPKSPPQLGAFRRADPKNLVRLSFLPPKTHPKKQSIFERLLAFKMTLKVSQNGPKLKPKLDTCLSSFSHRFFNRCGEAFFLSFCGD